MVSSLTRWLIETDQESERLKLTILLVVFSAQAAIVTSATLNNYVVPVFLVLIVVCTFLTIKGTSLAEIVIVLSPFTQPLPIELGARKLGFFPEYVAIPVIGFYFLTQRIRNANFAFEKTRLVLPSIFFLLIAFISLVVSGTETGLARTVSGFGTLTVFALALLAFLIFIEWFNDVRQVSRILLLSIIISSIVSVIGIVEYLSNYGSYGPSYRITSVFATWFWKEGGGNPNALGAYLMMVTLMAVSLRTLFQGLKLQVLNLVILLNIIAIFLTGSRSSLLATLVGIFVIAAWRDRRLILWSLPVGAAGVLIISGIPRVWERITSIVSIATDMRVLSFFSRIRPKDLDWSQIKYFGLSGYSIDVVAGANRITSWILGVKHFLLHPWLGIGLQMNVYYTGAETAENYFIDIALMTGVVGLAVSALLYARIVRLAWMAKHKQGDPFTRAFTAGYASTILGLFIVCLTGSVFFSLKVMLFFWMLTAMLWRLVQTRHIRVE